MHHLINLRQWSIDHAAQLLNTAKIATVILFAGLLAAQAWAPAVGALVLSVYVHAARVDDGDQS